MTPAIHTHPDGSILQAFLDDRLPEQQVDMIADHLSNCELCQQCMDRLSNCSAGTLTDTLRNLKTRVDFDFEKRTTNGEPQIVFENGKRYSLICEVARGGMGIIYRAQDPELQREIAIKIIHPELEVRIEDLIRFRREARLAGRLQHPGIVPIHELGYLHDGRMYIAMKLVDGTTLRELMESESTISEQKSHLLDVFNQVCQAIAYAHSKDIIHRDLKPENIMVGTFGEVQVMDWGLAKQVGLANSEVGDLLEDRKFVSSTTGPRRGAGEVQNSLIGSVTQFGSVFGTPAYMAPEQAQGEPTDKRADVFALGAILTEILTGSAPYPEGSSSIRLGKAAASDQEQAFLRLDASDCDISLINLAKDCLNPDPNLRPQDACSIQERVSSYFLRRDEQLRRIALANARNEARLISERKRRRQVLSLVGVIVSILLVTAAAGFMYLNEKSARKHQLLQQHVRQEARIQSAIRSANQLYAQAFESTQEEQADLWNQALIQINRAGVLVESIRHTEQKQELEETRRRIVNRIALAAKKVEQLRRDDAMSIAINETIRQAQYPNKRLQLHRDPQVVQDLQSSFREFGIAAHSDINQAAELIQSSRIRPSLVHGLRLWRAHISGKNKRLHDPKLAVWINQLTAAIDPDPFREKIRDFESSGDQVSAIDASKDPRALDSLLSVHTMIDCFVRLEQINELREYLEKARTIYPEDFEIHWRLGQIYRKGHHKNLKSALECFRICLSLQPDNPAVLIDVCGVLYDLEEFESAINYAEIMREKAPEYAEPFVTIAICLARMGRVEEGLEYCYRAISLREKFPMAQYNRSLMAELLDRRSEAVESANLAVQGRASVKHFAHRAKLYQKNGQLKAAIESLQPAINLYPCNRKILLKLGELHARSGELETALQYFRTADEWHPFDPVVIGKVAAVLIDQGLSDQAEDFLRFVTEVGGVESSRISEYLIEAIGEQGRRDEALELFDELLGDEPVTDLPTRFGNYFWNNLY